MNVAISEHSQSVSRAGDECGEDNQSLIIFCANPGPIAGNQVEIGSRGGTEDTLNDWIGWAAIRVGERLDGGYLESECLP